MNSNVVKKPTSGGKSMEEIDQLNIDGIDKEIIRLLVENPDITHEEIARRVSRSQPAVGARILKLKKKNLIANQFGINFKTAGLSLGIITFAGANPIQLKSYLDSIPQFVHVFKTSGFTNFMAFVAGTTMKEIDEIVDLYLRPHPDISDITLNYLAESLKNLVLPMAIETAPVAMPPVDLKDAIEAPLQPAIITRRLPKTVSV